MIPALSFIGRHNSGKTSLLINLINLLSKNGYRVGVIKHAHEEIQIPLAKDSEKLFAAGANQVYVSSPQIAINYQRLSSEQTLKEIYSVVFNENIDLILVEGFKEESLPKIEVLREEIDPIPLLAPNTIALVTDISIKTELPTFDFEQIEHLLNFIVNYFKLN